MEGVIIPTLLKSKLRIHRNKRIKKVLKVTYKVKGKRKKSPSLQTIAHLAGYANFMLEGHSFKYPLVIWYSSCYLHYTIRKDTNCLFLQAYSYVLYGNLATILKHNPSHNRYSKNYSTLISVLKVCRSFFAYYCINDEISQWVNFQGKGLTASRDRRGGVGRTKSISSDK